MGSNSSYHKKWPDIHKNLNIKKWITKLPKKDEKYYILDDNYYELLTNLIKNTNNILDDSIIDEVIGKERHKNPRLIRLSKTLHFNNKSLYDRLHFLSIIYPKVHKLLNGFTRGYHGFTKVYKKSYVISYIGSNEFKKSLIDEDGKVCVFNHDIRKGVYLKHNDIFKISWEIDSIRSLDINKIQYLRKCQSEGDSKINSSYKKIISINSKNKKRSVINILNDLNIYNDYNYLNLLKFIDCVFESSLKKLKSDNLEFTYYIYSDYVPNYIIRNGNIPDILTKEEEKKIFLNSINSLECFNKDNVSYLDVYGNDQGYYKLVDYYETIIAEHVNTKMKNLIEFYNNYSMVSDIISDSNITEINLNQSYTLTPLESLEFDYK